MNRQPLLCGSDPRLQKIDRLLEDRFVQFEFRDDLLEALFLLLKCLLLSQILAAHAAKPLAPINGMDGPPSDHAGRVPAKRREQQ